MFPVHEFWKPFDRLQRADSLRTVAFYNMKCPLHNGPEDYFESPSRFYDVYVGHADLADSNPYFFASHASSRLASEKEVLLAHTSKYLRQFFELVRKASLTESPFPVDEDTYVTADTFAAARAATGTVLHGLFS